MRAILAAAALAAGCHDLTPPDGATLRYERPAANLDVVWRGPASARRSAEPPPIAIKHCSDEDVPCMGKRARTGDVIVYAGTLSYRALDWSQGMFARDARSGHELWRARTGCQEEITTGLAVDAQRAYVRCDGHVLAYELGSGQLAWQRALDPRGLYPSHGTQITVGDGTVAFWDSSSGIHLADASSGAERATVPWSASVVGDLVIDDGVLYVAPMWAHDAGEKIAAYSASEGTELWHLEPSGDVVPPIFVDGDSLYASRAHELVAIDRATGAITWRRAVGNLHRFSIERSAGPSLLVVDTSDGQSRVFARGTAPAQPRSATITGRLRIQGRVTGPLAGLRVAIGPTTVKTDATGSFTARVTAVGAVEVTLLDLPAVAPHYGGPIVAVPAYVDVDRLADHYTTEIIVYEPPLD
jgi:outer membrane protein assembly factor BamB